MRGASVPAELVEELGSAFRTDDPGRCRELAAAVAQQLLETRAVPESIWHPLGFYRMEFGADSAGDRYAFHVWPAGMRSTQEPEWLVHRHVWPLKSFVTLGRLRDDQFDEPAVQADEVGARYLAVVVPGKSTLVRTGEELALSGLESALFEDAFYEIDLNRFHRTTVLLDELCITTVRIGPRSKPNSDVLGDVDGPAEVAYERRPVDLDSRIHALRELRSAAD
ncbi:MAG: hypothetical protein JNK12_05360 [Acidimicrobiales bacterium]|nr:hypothetical protein [Acidimicrobiales bacterium]